MLLLGYPAHWVITRESNEHNTLGRIVFDEKQQLRKHKKPSRLMDTRRACLMSSAKLQPHPLGVTCIIGPWNYPTQLVLRPLIGAIAAGNAVILKPSEVTDKVAQIIHEKLPQHLDSKMAQEVCGGAAATTALLKDKLDFLLFTGGASIGKIVLSACSKLLTPCCLKLSTPIKRWYTISLSPFCNVEAQRKSSKLWMNRNRIWSLQV